MEILVCIKQVPDEGVGVKLDLETKEPRIGHIRPLGNSFDRDALEMAVQFVEAHGGSVTVLTAGDVKDGTCLVDALAVGATEAYRVDVDTASMDGSQVADALRQGILQLETLHKAPFDLILCGRESTDLIGTQISGILAKKLCRPFAADLIAIDPELRQKTPDGYYVLECPKPLVGTMMKPNGYTPRYPTMMDQMKARRHEIPLLNYTDETTEKVTHLEYFLPPMKEKGILIEEKNADDTIAKAMQELHRAKIM